jgi:predicted RNase H-like HicB family nuclease
MSDFYVATLARNSEGEFFATVPDLPGANAAAATEKEALTLVTEFANDYVADLVADGHPVPPARSVGDIEVEKGEEGRVLIPVEVNPRPHQNQTDFSMAAVMR